MAREGSSQAPAAAAQAAQAPHSLRGSRCAYTCRCLLAPAAVGAAAWVGSSAAARAYPRVPALPASMAMCTMSSQAHSPV